MIRQSEGMGKVMTEDFAENKQETVIVNGGKMTETVEGSVVAEAGNGKIAVKIKNVNRAIWLSVVLFFMTGVLYLKKLIPEYPVVLVEASLWIVFLFLINYKKDINKNNAKKDVIKNKRYLDVFWFVALFFALDVFYVILAVTGHNPFSKMFFQLGADFFAVVFFILNIFVIYRYSGDEDPEINYRKFLESFLWVYIFMAFYISLLDSLMYSRKDIGITLPKMLWNELYYSFFMYYVICMPTSLFVVRHYKLFQRFHVFPKQGISKKKSRIIIILLILLNLLPFYVFMVVRTIWGIGLYPEPQGIYSM